MQSIGSDDQVEVADGAALQRDPYPSAVVVERAHAVAEDRLDAAAERVVDGGRELAARDTHVAPARASHEQLRIEGGDTMSVVADLPHLAHVIAAPDDLGRDAHAIGHVEPGAPEIDDVPAAARLRRALDERGPGDTGADDEDLDHINTA